MSARSPPLILIRIVTDPNVPQPQRLLDGGTIIVLFAVLAIAWVSADLRNQLHFPPFAEEARIAGHIARGDGFLSPYDASRRAPPTALNAPLYPAIIAAAYRVAGNSHAVLVLLALNSISFAAIAAGVYRLGKLYLSPLAGWLGAALVTAHPMMLYFATDWWDSFVALAIFVWLLVAAAWMPRWRRPLLVSALMGTAMGVLSLDNASYALTFPLLVLMGLRGTSRRVQIGGAAIALGAFVLVLAPWTIRNLTVFDRWYFVRGGTGLQLWLGNQPVASGWLEGDMLLNSPAADEDERNLMLNLGEPRYFDLCDRRFGAEYDAAPRQFWMRTARRLCFIFFSDPTKAYLPIPMITDFRWRQIYVERCILHGVVALLGLAGVWTAWRLRLGCLWILAAAILAEIPFLFTAVSDRYNLPMRVVLLLFAGMLLAAVIDRWRRGAWLEGAAT